MWARLSKEERGSDLWDSTKTLVGSVTGEVRTVEFQGFVS